MTPSPRSPLPSIPAPSLGLPRLRGPCRLPRAPGGLSALASRLRRNAAYQDRLLVAFHLYMWLRTTLAPEGELSAMARRHVTALLVATLLIVLASRGELLRDPRARVLVYRFGLLSTMLMSYLGLRHQLPALAPELVDAALLALDRRALGATPAQLLDRLVSPASVEWFAFFYYLHFFVLTLHVVGGLTRDRGRRRYELLFGTLIVACVGHATYTLMPGVGPYAAFPDLFRHALRGATYWQRVQQTVTVAGAQLDIFPSLHTAFPVFFTLHAIRHRHTLPFRLTWLATTFVTVNIVIATLFLRWHYGVDVVAGTLLAVVAQRIPVGLWSLEQARVARGGQPVWEPACRPAAARDHVRPTQLTTK